MAAMGSIFGGPEAAKSVLNGGGLDVALKGGYLKDKFSYDGGPPQAQEMISESESRFERIKHLKQRIVKYAKRANGELEDYQERRLNDYSEFVQRKRLFEIDNMKSLSPAAKIHMLDRYNKEYMRRAYIDEAKSELADCMSAIERIEKQVSTLGGLLPSNEAGMSKKMSQALYADKPSRG